jgi:predicted  nucleic acid-binding Zn-ribbon protein
MKTIAYYRREHKQMHDRVGQLEAELAARDAQQSVAVAEAVARTTAEHQVEYDRLAALLDSANEREVLLRGCVQKLAARVDALRAEQTQHVGELADARAEVDKWRTRAHEAEAGHDVAEANISELTKLLAKVEDRMKAKERQAAAAIQNRKALAGALPPIDRRR